MTIKIHPIPAFNDNYIWTLHDQQHAVVVDPGDATVTAQYIKKHQLNLIAILITHHHYDHVDGLVELQKQWNCPVYAPNDDRIPGQLTTVENGDQIIIKELNLKLNVLFTPGHTLTHICYHDNNKLFCGDTLFSLGCGRMFEGTAEQFHSSLKTLKHLNAKTKVYCTHEYTESNYQFAQTVIPSNNELTKFKAELDSKRQKGLPSIPSTMAIEQSINPFLNCENQCVISAVSQKFNHKPNSEAETFAMLRRWKDNF